MLLYLKVAVTGSICSDPYIYIYIYASESFVCIIKKNIVMLYVFYTGSKCSARSFHYMYILLYFWLFKHVADVIGFKSAFSLRPCNFAICFQSVRHLNFRFPWGCSLKEERLNDKKECLLNRYDNTCTPFTETRE